MGMSTHVVAFRAPDAKWHEMKKVWDSCKAAKVKVPDEVSKFFEYGTPDESGVAVEIEKTACCKEWSDHRGEAYGYEVELSKLPKDITHIRFYNSI